MGAFSEKHRWRVEDGPTGVAHRRMVYCIIPRALAPQLHELLREHWKTDPSVVVITERRRAERRREERRRETDLSDTTGDRRRIPGAAGRRVADQRAVAVGVAPLDLPPTARRHADRLTFIERIEPNGRTAEDAEINRLLVRLQSGEVGAFDLIYMRYFDRVYGYARVALRDPHEAEDVTQQVFANVIQALPRYQVRKDLPFRAWLFRITRNAVLRAVSRNGRLHPEEPAELDRRLEHATVPTLRLDWPSDTDLAMLVERLPLAQRQVIMLRYVFELTTDEIAGALERTPTAIRMLEHRAMRGLEARLAALRGRAKRCDRSSMVARARQAPVIAARQLALQLPGVPSL